MEMADSTLNITLLGDFRLTYADQPVWSVNTERLQSLLAYLVLHHQSPQPRSRLAFYFWADSGEAQARTNLRRELHYLRQALPDADRFLQADAKTIQWRTDAPFTLDVAEFEAAIAQAEQAERDADWALVQQLLEKAATLYQGDLLPNCYEDWIESERSELQQSCIRALERLIRLLEQQQDYPAAIRYAQQLLRIEPLQESTYCTLMRLYAGNGDRASAMRIYQQCADILQRELDDEPGTATREVYEQVRTMKLPLVAKPPQPSAPVSIVPQMPVKAATALIGRSEEWREIAAWMEHPRAKILVLMGEPGIGKTRVLEEIAATTQTAGVSVLWGRGFEAEMLRPYGVWIDAFRAFTTHQAIDLPKDLSSWSGVQSSVNDRTQLFDAVVQCLSQLSTNGNRVAVILDDMQWLDEASTALFHYASRLLSSGSVLWVGAARQQELENNPAVFKLVQALRREQRIKAIPLLPLNSLQTAALVQTINPDIDCERVFAESGGNPLFALEIARAQSNATHLDNLEALIQARLQQLSESTRELIPWAAALGHHFSPSLIAQIVGLPMTKLLTAIEQLEQYHLIRPSASVRGDVGYDFAHDIVRQVAYNQLSEPRRRLVHQQIAHVLNNLCALDSSWVSEVAHHADLAGNHPLAAATCMAAAEQCLRLFAYAEASELAARGIQHCQYLDVPQRIVQQLKLLKVTVLAGVTRDRVPQLEHTLQQQIEEASRLNLKEAEAIGLEALLIFNYDRDRVTDVHQQSLRAIETGRASSPTTTARMLAYSGSCLAELQQEIPRAEALLLEARSLAERVGLDLTDVFIGLGCIHQYRCEFEAARQHLTQAWKLAQSEQDHWRECSTLKYLAMLELDAGAPEAALTYCQEMLTVAAQMSDQGSEKPMAIALDALARYYLQQPDAEARLAQALTTLRQIDAKLLLAYVLTRAAEWDLDHENLKFVESLVEEALRSAQITHHTNEIALAWVVRIRYLWACGQYEQAREQLQDLRCNLEESGLSERAQRAIAQLIQTWQF